MTTLLLIPTELERRYLQSQNAVFSSAHVCGFGPLNAAVRTAMLLNTKKPSHVILTGIAGSYDLRLCPLGGAVCFETVAMHGIGAGEGDDFLTASEMGFSDAGAAPGSLESFPLVPHANCEVREQLLTVCAASGKQLAVEQKRRSNPRAVAEDMEGFGVAMACAAHGTPLTIIRGVSNLAGVRDKSAWRIDEAMRAVSGVFTHISDCDL